MDEKNRCSWCLSSDKYKKYHDQEWGKPVYDDATLFEFMLLETFQAGLSWITILNKRENFRLAFDNFDFIKIANYNHDKIMSLMQNTGIIRNKLKIYAAAINAQNFIKVQQEFGSFSKYIWDFVDGKPIDNEPRFREDVPSSTLLSEAISKDLKKRGFKFMGSTTTYAHMQATGMVNDHYMDCWTRN